MRIYAVLLLLLLIGALMAVGSPITAQVTTTTLTPGGVIVIATAIPSATLFPTQTNGCYPPLALTVGSDVILRGGINVRSAPSLSAALVNYYPTSVQLHLDGGPTCVNGYNWWQVSGVGEPGWVIEGKPGQYFLEPFVNPNTNNCAEPLASIQVGGTLLTVTGSRIRLTPDNSGFVLTVVPPHTALSVIDGPRCVDGLNWWRVRAPYEISSTFVNGWIAEGFPTNYFVQGLNGSAQAAGEPALRCSAPLRLHNGTRAAVTYQDGVPRHLRSSPSATAPVITDLLDGIEFQVINDNSTCADGYNWWQVQIVATGLTGWLAEGRPGAYWFDVLIN